MCVAALSIKTLGAEAVFATERPLRYATVWGVGRTPGGVLGKHVERFFPRCASGPRFPQPLLRSFCG